MDSPPPWVDSGVVKESRENQDPQEPFPLRVRIVQIFFLALGVIATLLLAWWQYERWQSTSGSFQNLGYALQWPIFGIFLVVTYRKYIEYERERLRGDDEAAVEKYAEDQLTEVPEDFLAPTAKQRPEAAEIFEDHRRRDARSAPLPAQDERRKRQADEG